MTKTIIVKIGSPLPSNVDAQAKVLAEAYAKVNPGKPAVEYKIVYDPSATTLESLEEQQKLFIKTNLSDQECYLIYQAALALGADPGIAYAAYLVCINAN